MKELLSGNLTCEPPISLINRGTWVTYLFKGPCCFNPTGARKEVFITLT
jgi:hypothetical protein